MRNKVLRIKANPNGDDQYIKFQLNQQFDFLEILSLKLTQNQVYRSFSANYGCLIGRVIANRGFGVPNARVSVFVPLDENETDSKILSAYPYSTPFDLDADGIRYNLLEDEPQSKCHTSVGTFPSKRKVLDDDTWLEIYDTYYKYSTVTNESGDYMIMGIPIGNQTVHMDVDLSDIGFVSMKPYDLIAQGYSDALFQTKTRFKGGSDLDSLVQIQSRNIPVNIKPFWGDTSKGDIGVNRLDINLGVEITPTALFFGGIFSDSRKSFINLGCKPQSKLGKNCDLSSGKGLVEYVRRVSRDSNLVEYVSNNQTKIDDDGNWAFAIPMNLDRVITDEFGNIVPSLDPNVGLPTKVQARFRISLDEFRFGFRRRTAHYLVPNMYNRFHFGDDTDDDDFYEMDWKGVYTVTNYIPRYQKDDILKDESKAFTGIKNIGECENTAPFPYNRINIDFNPLYNILCVLIAAAGEIIDIINWVLKAIIFNVVLKFSCFIKHPFDADMRSACRCQACLNLNSDIDGAPSPPLDWDGSIDVNGNLIDDRLECATCYDADGDGATGTTLCTGFSYSLCGGLCQDCNITFIPLFCNEIPYTGGAQWADCVSENLAEQLGVITYEFYNDWVVGSLYSYLFQYKIKYKKNGKELERFCDADCRPTSIPISDPQWIDDPHRKNICRESYIVDRQDFNAGNWDVETINPNDGRGLIVEYDDYLYYAARHDVESNPSVVSDLTVLGKDKLLFATNIVDLGSSVLCDIQNRPYLVDRLEASSYQKDEGTKTLFNVSNCGQPVQDINYNGILLESQIGVDILVAESSRSLPFITGDDGENYELFGVESGLPDYDNQQGVLILDRDDLILRRYLCENFDYFGVPRTYNTVSHPTGLDYLEDSDNEIVTSTTDFCAGFDDFSTPANRMHPYYMYFGIKQGNTSLEKLKTNYFDDCI